MRGGEGQETGVVDELCAIFYAILRCPHLAIPTSSAAAPASPPPRHRMSPAGFASLLLGASLALMLCGSVTFIVGCILMPWVLGLLLVLYFVGIVSNLSGIGRAILCPGDPPKETPGQFSPKFPVI